MPAVKNTFSPRPWQSLQDPNLHSGITPVVGSATIDLGIGHNNFVCSPSIQLNGSGTEGPLANTVYWTYGPQPGQISFSVFKRAASFGAWIPETVSRNVSFTVIADSSVG